MKTSADVPMKVIAGEGDKMRTSPVLVVFVAKTKSDARIVTSVTPCRR
jgi:hypothetical protein